MRRLGRYILNGFTGLSLLLCAATCVLWVRSHRLADDVRQRRVYGPEGRRAAVEWEPPIRGGANVVWHLASDAGRVSLSVDGQYVTMRAAIPGSPEDSLDPAWDSAPPDPEGLAWAVWRVREDGGWAWGGLGFSHVREDDRAGDGEVIAHTSRWHVLAPYWVPFALFLALPAARGYRAVRRRRRPGAGLCPACGYDLRATPDRFPECGRRGGLGNTRMEDGG